jgi:GNAT superfamily N-acetyltransferase
MNGFDSEYWISQSATLASSAFRKLLPSARFQAWSDVVVSDSADPHWLYNWAVVISRVDRSRSSELVEKLRRFYGADVDGYSVWDPWCSLELPSPDFESEALPFMVRGAGGLPSPRPSDLSIRRCSTVSDLQAFGRIVTECFDPPGGTGAAASHRFAAIDIADGSFRAWLGEVGGAPVSCAYAFVAANALYVDFVATLPEYRGRGYGEALTWVATVTEPHVPATLHATEDGKSTYVRMGFRTVADAHLWYPTAAR